MFNKQSHSTYSLPSWPDTESSRKETKVMTPNIIISLPVKFRYKLYKVILTAVIVSFQRTSGKRLREPNAKRTPPKKLKCNWSILNFKNCNTCNYVECRLLYGHKVKDYWSCFQHLFWYSTLCYTILGESVDRQTLQHQVQVWTCKSQARRHPGPLRYYCITSILLLHFYYL